MRFRVRIRRDRTATGSGGSGALSCERIDAAAGYPRHVVAITFTTHPAQPMLNLKEPYCALCSIFDTSLVHFAPQLQTEAYKCSTRRSARSALSGWVETDDRAR
ncbi:hypothetical protein GCM10027088_64460 [Nocardia goodfellowii]